MHVVTDVQPSGTSGAIGILDLNKQRLDKIDIRAKQYDHRMNGPLSERETLSGNAKAAKASIQARFLKQVHNEQAQDIEKYGSQKQW